jgi:hypothetical protein
MIEYIPIESEDGNIFTHLYGSVILFFFFLNKIVFDEF